MEILRWVLVVASIPLIVMLVIHTRKRIHALERRIEEYREEQEAAKSQPSPINPYEDLSRIMQMCPRRSRSDNDKKE